MGSLGPVADNVPQSVRTKVFGFFWFSRGFCYVAPNCLWFFLVCLVSSVILLYIYIYTYIAMYQPYTVYYILYTTMSYYILLCITIDYHIPLYLSVTSTYYMYCMVYPIQQYYYVLLCIVINLLICHMVIYIYREIYHDMLLYSMCYTIVYAT